MLQLPALLACLILAGHFLRWGNLPAVLLCLLIPAAALISKSRPVLRAWQALLALGSVLWVGTAVSIGRERLAEGKPFIRMALILGGVAVFTGFSAWLLSRKSLLERYR